MFDKKNNKSNCWHNNLLFKLRVSQRKGKYISVKFFMRKNKSFRIIKAYVRNIKAIVKDYG